MALGSRQEAQGLHKEGRVNGQVGDVARHASEGQDALHVVCKAAPVPEVVGSKSRAKETDVNPGAGSRAQAQCEEDVVRRARSARGGRERGGQAQRGGQGQREEDVERVRARLGCEEGTQVRRERSA